MDEWDSIAVQCLPTNAAGQPLPLLADAPPGELDGASAAHLSDFSAWTHHFNSTVDAFGSLFFSVFLLVDTRQLDYTPVIALQHMTPQQALAAQQLAADGQTGDIM